MTATVTLRLVQGRLDRTEYMFDERITCILGRADDCAPRLPNNEYHRTVSRQAEPVPIRRREPTVPASLAEVIDGALRESPKSAFHTADELRRALLACSR
jgi:hypothetical protein